DLPVDGHLVDRAAAGRLQPGLGHAVLAGLADHLRVVGIEEYVQLRLVEVLLAGRRGGRLDAVGVIQQHAEVADAPDAGLRADGRLPDLDPREAEGALLRLPALPIVVDLLVRAGGDAHPPTPALV